MITKTHLLIGVFYGRQSRGRNAKVAHWSRRNASSADLSGYAVCKNLQTAGVSSARLWVIRDMMRRLGLGADMPCGQSRATLEASMPRNA